MADDGVMSIPPERPQRPSPFGAPGTSSAPGGAIPPKPILGGAASQGGPAGIAPLGGSYTMGGAISVEELVEGDPNRFRHLDKRIEDLVTNVQKDLIDTTDAKVIDGARESKEKKQELVQIVDRLAYKRLLNGPGINPSEQPYVIASVVNEIVGLGPLEPLWQDPSITEVIVNGPEEVFVERRGMLLRAKGIRFRSQKHLLDVSRKIVNPLNRKLDVKSPLVDGRLPDGSRVNVVHQAIAPKGPLLTIRRFPEVNRSLVDLVELGAMSKDMARTLAWLVRARASSVIAAGTGTGKLLPLGTPIPTPLGWTTMGELQPGDMVLGRDGNPCKVVFCSDVVAEPTLYRLTLSDGQEIVADADHQWVVSDADQRKQAGLRSGAADARETVVTTQQMVDQIAQGEPGVSGFAIRTTRALLLPERHDLPVEPYVLGVWLGRGIQGTNRFVDLADEVRTEMARGGATVVSEVGSELGHVAGLAARLGRASVFDDKHIPVKYLRASLEQRLSLLQGLMDSCGHVLDRGACSIELENKQLARNVQELIRTLGIQVKCETAKKDPTAAMPRGIPGEMASLMSGFVGTLVNGMVETTNRVTGRPGNSKLCRMEFETDLPVFRRGYCLERLHSSRVIPSEWHYIASIVLEPTQPGKCIQVDSPDSTYLAAGFIPTHNTTMLNALSAAIPLQERVITIEDSLELRLNPKSHVAAMEARPADAAGENAITIRNLVKNALRQRPDRIIVGEVRDEAALEMLNACNTGHEGSMTTLHANGPNEVVARLAVMVAQGGEFPTDKVDWLVGSALDIVIMLKRYRDGSRRVSGVYEVPELSIGASGVHTVPLWEWHRTGTDDQGRAVGEYVERQPISDRLKEKLGLDFEPFPSWEELSRLGQ